MHTMSFASYQPSEMPPVSAMILAAGRGMRMRPLTDHTPKPLLEVQGKALMDWPLQKLLDAGVCDIVVNTAWLGEHIEAHCQHYPDSRARIRLSNEGRDFGYALETAGGIVRALPDLGEVFWVLAGDVFAPQFAFDAKRVRAFINSPMLAHLWLVPNPSHNPGGDFRFAPGQDNSGTVHSDGAATHTFSTVGLYKKALFQAPWTTIAEGNPQGSAAPLAPLLRNAMRHGLVSGELYMGEWTDVGTPERLADINASA